MLAMVIKYSIDAIIVLINVKMKLYTKYFHFDNVSYLNPASTRQ